MNIALEGTPRNVRRVSFTINDKELYIVIKHNLDSEDVDVLVTDYYDNTHVPDVRVLTPNTLEMTLDTLPPRPFTIRITG